MNKGPQAVRCVVNPYHLILKVGRGDQKNTALTVSLLESQSDTEDGGKRKGDPGKKARLVVLSFLYSGEVCLGRTIEVTIWLTVK